MTGTPRLIYTPQELHAKHLRFWNAGRIQEFCSGAVSRQSMLDYGRGFAEKNQRRIVQFPQAYLDEQTVVTLLRQLSWSHFLALLPLDQPFQRDF